MVWYNYKLQNRWTAVWKCSRAHRRSRTPSAKDTSRTITERSKTRSSSTVPTPRKISSSFPPPIPSSSITSAPPSKTKKCKALSIRCPDPRGSPRWRRAKTKDFWLGRRRRTRCPSSFWLICIPTRRNLLPQPRSKGTSSYRLPSTALKRPTQSSWLLSPVALSTK